MGFFAGDNAGSHVHCSCGGAAEAVSDGAAVDPETAGHDLCQKHTPSPPARQSQGTVVPLTVGPLLLLQLRAIKLIPTSYDHLINIKRNLQLLDCLKEENLRVKHQINGLS